MSDKVPELSAGEFDNFVSNGVVVVDFFAEWCMPCMMMLPIVDDLADDFLGKARIGKVDVGEHEQLAQKFKVSSIPNFTIFKDGEIVEQLTGSQSYEILKEKIEGYL